MTVFDLMPILRMTIGEATKFRLAVFATRAFKGEIVLSHEVSAARWMRPDAIGALATTPDLDKVLARAFAPTTQR